MCKRLIYVMTFVLALGSTAQAAVYLWNGSAGDGLWETPLNWTVTDSLWTWPNEENTTDPNYVNSDVLGIDIINGGAVTRGDTLRIKGADELTTAVLTLDNASSLSVSGRLSIGTDPDGAPRMGELNVLGGSILTILDGLNGNDLYAADDLNTVGTINIVDSTVTVFDNIVIDEGVGYINISGSSTITADGINIGDNETGVGYLDISGTTTVELGGADLETDEGEGHITIGGSATLNCDDLYIAEKPNVAGTLLITDNATVTTVDDLRAGDEGTGTITVGGSATVNVGDDASAGNDANSVGTINIGDDATVNFPDELYIANNAGSQGEINISGNATVNIGDDLNVGDDGPGTCNIGENATVIVADDIYVAHNVAEGAFESHMTISGNASVTCQDLIVANNGGLTGYLHISGNPMIHTTGNFYMNDDEGDPATSQVIMDGGTVTVDGYTTFNDDNPGTAEFIMNGGSFYSTDYLNLSDNLDGIAHLTMNGGEMITGNRLRLGKDGGEDTGQVRIFMNGGLLQAEELSDIKITDTQIIYKGGEFRIRQPFQPDPVGDPDNWWGLSEADMQNLIDIGTIEASGVYSITTDGDYTVLKSPSATEIDIRIANGSDDAEQHLDDGDMDIGSSDLELVYEDAGNPTTDEQVIGLRFVKIPIPKGTQVTGAYVEFEVDKVDKEGSEYPVNLIIEGELAPDAAPFEDVANNITDRTSLTTAKAKWSIPAWTEQNAKWQTPDISSIIQEIVNQDAWVSGNAIVLIFRDDKDDLSTGLREAESYNGEADAAPMLHITAIIEIATQPDPADGAEGVPIGTSLSWSAGSDVASHDVYFGTSSPPEFIGNQEATTYYPGPLEPGTTYYWQIDEVKADGTIIIGDIWSFTNGFGNFGANIRIAVENDDGEDHIAYGGQADDGAESRGSSDLEMPWESGVQSSSLQVIGLRFIDIPIPKGVIITDAYVQFTGDDDNDEKLIGGPVNLIVNGLLQTNPDGFSSGENFYTDREPKTIAEAKWTDIPEWSNRQATDASRTQDISSVIQEIINQDDWSAGNALMLFFRDDETNPSAATRSALSNGEGAGTEPLLHITAISEIATQPSPANGAENVPLDTILSWWPGFGAVSHDGYIGTSSPPPFIGNTPEVTFDPALLGGLQPSTTYYWQLNAVEADGTTHTGEIWSFTTAGL